jgi:hypothetical protein
VLVVSFLLLLSGIIFTGLGTFKRAQARTKPNDRMVTNPTLRPAFPPQISLGIDWLTGDLRPKGSYLVLIGAICLIVSMFLVLFLLYRDSVWR